MLSKRVSILLLWIFLGCQKPPPPSKPPPPVKVATAIEKKVPIYIQTVGYVQPLNTVEVKSQVTGVITALQFEEGSQVNQGDLLVKIDDRPYIAALNRAKAALSESLAELKYNRDTAKRNAPLAKDEYISQNSYESLLTNVSMSEAKVEQNQAEKMTAEVNLSYCVIYSPIKGVISERFVDLGNLVLENEGTSITRINQISPIYVSFYVIEKDLANIRELFQSKTLPVHASYTTDFTKSEQGFLTFIDNEVDQATGMIKLKGIFVNETSFLWPGEYANVRLILEEDKHAILIPSQAVNMGQKGKYVFVVNEDKRVKMRQVETGQREGEFTIIQKGLKKDEVVVTDGQINLADGRRVRIVKE